jgi:predicted nucleic acid-binding protein
MDARSALSTLYAESSAVLRWLLEASEGDRVEHALVTARTVVTSALTSAEVGRTLQRLVATDQIDGRAGERVWARYSVASRHWHIYRLDDEVLTRAAQTFPREPVRALDAIHLATALRHTHEVDAPTMLSLDSQVRANARALGLGVAP